MDYKLLELSNILEVEQSTIVEWINEKKLPAYKINNQYWFNKNEIHEWAIKNNVDISDKLLNHSKKDQLVNILKIIEKSEILYDVEGCSINDAIKNVINSISIPSDLSRDVITYFVLQREEMMPTSIGLGIAIPHPRNPIISDIENESLTIAFLKNPLEYDTIDNIPIHTLFMILSANVKRHLEMLSHITYLCKQEQFIELLKSKANKEMIFKYIAEHGK